MKLTSIVLLVSTSYIFIVPIHPMCHKPRCVFCQKKITKQEPTFFGSDIWPEIENLPQIQRLTPDEKEFPLGILKFHLMGAILLGKAIHKKCLINLANDVLSKS
jgi:hypothetical protein